MKLKLKQASLLLVISMTAASIAHSNPQGGSVAAGDINIKQSAGYTEVEQASRQGIVDWNSFNIAAGEHTHFQQPTNGVTLNRINPTQGASTIAGRLTATGRIILVNGAGI